MKICSKCGAQAEDQVNFCAACGSSEFYASAQNSEQPTTQYYNAAEQNPAYQQPVEQPFTPPAINENSNGSILSGVVGAFLFSIIGGLLYFVVYQIGFVAGICGLVIFVLANFGYGLFAKTKDKNSLAGLITSIIAMIVMIFLAEFLCVSFEIYQEFKDAGATFFDAVRATPEFLAMPEVGEAIAGDLVFAYIFGFIASIGNIVTIVKARKAQKQANNF